MAVNDSLINLSLRVSLSFGRQAPRCRSALSSSHGVRGGIAQVNRLPSRRAEMAAGNLPPPAALDIHSEQAGERWIRFKRAWDSYALATGLTEKAEAVQMATLLTVNGEGAREVYSTFTGWAREGDSAKIGPVLEKFRQYCEPRKNVPFVSTADAKNPAKPTAITARNCDFRTITPDELLRDRLVFGIRDNKIRERLLREPALTLARTDKICHAAESTVTQLKLVEDHTTNVSALDPPIKECSNCGQRHPDTQRCPALGKTCRKCQKKNYFAAKCRSTQTRVRAVDEEDLTREEESDNM